MNEDSERTVIYVDMLGFANLTERFPTHLIHSGPDEEGFRSSSSTETFNTFNRFHRILDKCVFDQRLNGPIRAMLFSDCAFLELGTSLLTAVSATELMRSFIRKNSSPYGHRQRDILSVLFLNRAYGLFNNQPFAFYWYCGGACSCCRAVRRKGIEDFCSPRNGERIAHFRRTG